MANSDANITSPHKFLPDGSEEVVIQALYQVYLEILLSDYHFCVSINGFISTVKPYKELRLTPFNFDS